MDKMQQILNRGVITAMSVTNQYYSGNTFKGPLPIPDEIMN